MSQSRTVIPSTQAAGHRLEASWLLAVATVPLAVSTFTDGPFEPIKASLALAFGVLAAGWLLAQWRLLMRALRTNSIVAVAAAYVVVTGLAAAVSVAPWTSLFGSFHRAQGLVTTLAYGAIFLAIATNVRRVDQARRVVWAVVLAATLMSVVGLAQNFGVEPLALMADPGRRSPATAGNPIFFGAFLAFGIILATAAAVAERGLRRWAWLGSGALQCIAMIGTGSRGPWLGLIAGLAALGWLCRRAAPDGWLRTRRAWIAAAMLLVIVAAAWLAFGDDSIRRVMRLDRSGTIQVRLDAWDAVSRTMLSPSATADVLETPLAPWRMAVGYGPETMAIPVSANVSEAQTTLANREGVLDRAHNEVLQHLVERGTAGVFALLAVWFAVLRAAIAPRCPRATWSAAAPAVVFALLAPWLSTGSLAWSGALAAAAVVAVAFWPSVRATAASPLDTRGVLLAGVAAAVVGHVVELQSGILVTPTAVAFWALAGLVASPWGRGDPAEGRDDPALVPRVAGAAAAVVLLGFAVAPDDSIAHWAYLAPPRQFVILGAVVALVAAACVGLVRFRPYRVSLAIFMTSLVGVTAVSALCWWIGSLGPPATLPGQPYWLAAGACAIPAALVFAATMGLGEASTRRRALLAAGLAVAAIAVPTYDTLAASFAGLGNVSARHADPARGIDLYGRALTLAPRSPVRWQRLAGLHLVESQSGRPQAAEHGEAALAALRTAVAQAPLDSDAHSDLGEMLTWQAAARPTESRELLDQAIHHLERALQLRPASEETLQRLRTARNLQLVISR